MQLNEQEAGLIASVLIAIGYGLKQVFKWIKSEDSEEDRTEERRSRTSIFQSLREQIGRLEEEIERLNEQVATCNRRADTELAKRIQIEIERGRLQAEVENLSARLGMKR